jgi:hypothetical protein
MGGLGVSVIVYSYEFIGFIMGFCCVCELGIYFFFFGRECGGFELRGTVLHMLSQ